jgi:hypothetical protein
LPVYSMRRERPRPRPAGGGGNAGNSFQQLAGTLGSPLTIQGLP